MKKILISALFFTGLCGTLAMASESPASYGGHGRVVKGPSAEEALAKLLQGNQRFVKGEAQHPGDTPARREELVSGQHPIAAVLTCSDSRVPPEILFDQGLGDIFVVRVAGNVAGASEQGSIEYAAEHLNVPVLMVLGHTSCGAVKAASAGGKAEGALASVMKELEPAVKAAKAHGAKGDELVPAVVEQNVRLTALNLMRKNSVVRRLVAEGRLKVSAGIYDLNSGEVTLLDLEKELRADRQAKGAALRGLLKKMRTGDMSEDERNSLYSGVMELLTVTD